MTAVYGDAKCETCRHYKIPHCVRHPPQVVEVDVVESLATDTSSPGLVITKTTRRLISTFPEIRDAEHQVCGEWEARKIEHL
jgi:hypothetical protein